MDGRIGLLRCRFKLVGGDQAALRGALERIDRRRVTKAWERGLEAVFGTDPTVYAVRRVSARLSTQVSDGMDGAELARRLGEGLAGAVVRAIADDPSDGSNVIRFDDQADYVARFLVDLLDGRAWSRWCY